MFEVEGKRLASLNLSPSQLDKYVELKHNWNTLHTQRMKEALKVNNQDYNILHNQLTKQMNVDLIYPIFDHDQLKKYLSLKTTMYIKMKMEIITQNLSSKK